MSYQKNTAECARKYPHNILNNTQDAEECVNDAYLGTWNSIPPQRPSPLSTYVYRIVRNLSIKKYHANTAAKRNSYYDIALEELEDCLPSSNTHGACSAIGFILFLFVPLFLAILSFKANDKTIGIIFVISFVLALLFFVLFIMADKPELQRTFIAKE